MSYNIMSATEMSASILLSVLIFRTCTNFYVPLKNMTKTFLVLPCCSALHIFCSDLKENHTNRGHHRLEGTTRGL